MTSLAPQPFQFHDHSVDDESEISSITTSGSEETTPEHLALTGKTQPGLDLRDEAEDECGELYTRPFPSRNTKRFSSLSMASSIAAIIPFIAPQESKLALGFATPSGDRDKLGRAPHPHEQGWPLEPHNRRRLRGSVPQLSMLLQKAAANAQSESITSLSAKIVDEWASSLAESFDTEGLSSDVMLKFPLKDALLVPPPPPKQAKLHEGSAKWKLRPLSTWGRKSVVNPPWSAAHATAPLAGSPPSLVECDESTISALSSVSTRAAADNATGSSSRTAYIPPEEAAVKQGTGTGTAANSANSANSARPTARIFSRASLSTGAKAVEDKSEPSSAANRRISTTHLRNSRFWQLVRPTTEPSIPEEEPLDSSNSNFSELSAAARREDGPRESRGSKSPEMRRATAAAKESSASPPRANGRKRSRLLKLWYQLVPSSVPARK